MNVNIDTTELSRFALDINRESVLVRRRNEAAVRTGIDHVYDKAIETAQQWRDTGAMIAATRKIGRGYTRRVRCDDPAGMMNEFGAHGRAPRPWLLIQADGGAAVVAQEMLRGIDEFLR